MTNTPPIWRSARKEREPLIPAEMQDTVHRRGDRPRLGRSGYSEQFRIRRERKRKQAAERGGHRGHTIRQQGPATGERYGESGSEGNRPAMVPVAGRQGRVRQARISSDTLQHRPNARQPETCRWLDGGRASR